jgi:small basic protein
VFALIGLIVGALVALVLRPTVPADMTRYVAMGVVAAVDASFGGVRAYVEHTFNDRVFVLAFVSNAVVAAGLVWLGDQLAVDLTTAVAVVFGIRIFQNLAALRRRLFGG